MNVVFRLLNSRLNNGLIMKKSIFFMHIPKCGGTTIDQIFLKLSEILGSFNFKRFKHQEGQEVKNSLMQNNNDSIPNFISGHLDYDFTKNIKNIFKCTIVREPTDRIISHYKFQLLKLKKNPSNYTFNNFIKSEFSCNRDNLITRHFVGLLAIKKKISINDKKQAIKNINLFDSINIFDNWESFVSDLLSTFNLPSVLYSRFQEHSYSFKFKPNKSDLELIRKYYKYDFEIYGEIKKYTLDKVIKKNYIYNKNICLVSPHIKTENKLFTKEQLKDLLN